MGENKLVRRLLIWQSFLPLAVLLLIQNFDFKVLMLTRKFFLTSRREGIYPALCVMVSHSKALNYFIMIGCILWIIRSLYATKQFHNIQFFNFIESDDIQITNASTETGATFFVTFIMPLLVNDLEKPQNFLIFMVLLFIMILLVYRTSLYYQNPVLTVLVYKTFTFSSPAKICLCQTRSS